MKELLSKLKDLEKKVKGFFRKKEDVLELEEIEEEGIVYTLRIDKINQLSDVERIIRIIKDGNIGFIKIKELQRRDPSEFQLSLQKVKRYCNQFGWDVVALEEGYLVIAPSFAVIERG